MRVVKFELSNHARRAVAEREISNEWIERTLQAPELIVPDPNDATIERYFSRIPEFGGRVLRVAVNKAVEPNRVVSVFFDRKNEGQTMRLHVDKKADALYLRLDDSKIIESEEVAPGVILDYNDKDEVVGVEMLYLSKRTPNLKTTALEFESV